MQIFLQENAIFVCFSSKLWRIGQIFLHLQIFLCFFPKMTQKIQIYLQMSIFFRNIGTPLYLRRGDAPRCHFLSKPKVNWLLHPPKVQVATDAAWRHKSDACLRFSPPKHCMCKFCRGPHSTEKYRCAITFLCRSTCPYASISRHSCTKKCTTMHIFLRKSLQMSIFFRNFVGGFACVRICE